MSKQLTFVWALLLMLLFAGCGSGSDIAAPVGPAPAITGIDPAGGTVTGSNGATITVPAGALSQTVAPAVPPIGDP